MLHALDDTLKKFLEKKFSEKKFEKDILSELKVSFDTPYRGAIEEKPAINLFLYDVQENLELRNKNWFVERPKDSIKEKAVKKRLPARVDCSYLITVWCEKDEDSKHEHELLGEVMKLLLRYRTIPQDCLSAELRGQELPLRLLSLRPSSLQSFGEFWQAMGGKDGTKPKVVLHCTVTISVPLEEEGEEVVLVGAHIPSS